MFQLVIFIILVFFSINAWIIFDSRNDVHDDVANIAGYDVWLVLWASVRSDWSLSPILQQRVDAAISLYNKWYIRKIVVSWYDKDETYLEAMSMWGYMLSNSVEEWDVYVDSWWYDTLASVQRLRKNFDIDKIVIFTQRYHLWRSVFLAKNNNIDAVWFTVDDDMFSLSDIFTLREMLARVKAFVEIYII